MKENENKLHLADLIDINILRQIQDAFSEMTEMAGITTNCNCIALTAVTRVSWILPRPL